MSQPRRRSLPVYQVQALDKGRRLQITKRLSQTAFNRLRTPERQTIEDKERGQRFYYALLDLTEYFMRELAFKEFSSAKQEALRQDIIKLTEDGCEDLVKLLSLSWKLAKLRGRLTGIGNTIKNHCKWLMEELYPEDYRQQLSELGKLEWPEEEISDDAKQKYTDIAIKLGKVALTEDITDLLIQVRLKVDGSQPKGETQQVDDLNDEDEVSDDVGISADANTPIFAKIIRFSRVNSGVVIEAPSSPRSVTEERRRPDSSGIDDLIETDRRRPVERKRLRSFRNAGWVAKPQPQQPSGWQKLWHWIRWIFCCCPAEDVVTENHTHSGEGSVSTPVVSRHSSDGRENKSSSSMILSRLSGDEADCMAEDPLEEECLYGSPVTGERNIEAAIAQEQQARAIKKLQEQYNRRLREGLASEEVKPGVTKFSMANG
ncbi:MAG: hypothetical protein CMF50_01475 [Legionellales bacterium]|nr:hypothetical protein [Legionellales bacterium]|tara:strand:+ start:16475 stop:17767 length:1293 start_codon:yes stop_codon:yes gene_type:complete